MHCIVYDCRVIGLYAVTMVPGWSYQAKRTLSAKAQLVSAVVTPLIPDGQMVKLSALAGEAVPIPAAAVMLASTAAAPKRAELEIALVTMAPQFLRPKWMVKSATHVR